MKKQKAIFLDRDGVINVDNLSTILENRKAVKRYVYKIGDFKFMPRVMEALINIPKDYIKIILTNQAGIGRGYYTKEQYFELTSWMLNQFKDKSIIIDRVYFCPHSPEQGCACRKPKIGLVEQAVRDFGIDLSQSWMIGDKETDIEMGKSAGCKTILIPSVKLEGTIHPDYVAKDLYDAIDFILKYK